jgi:hypothetical protein
MKPIARPRGMIDLMRRWRALQMRRGLFCGVDRLVGRPPAPAVEALTVWAMGGDSWGDDGGRCEAQAVPVLRR